MGKKLLSDDERFERSIERIPFSECWIWQLSLDPDGYGHYRIGSRKDGTRRREMAHRWAYERFVRKIPGMLTIDHLCRNRDCVNPSHLEPVSSAVNTKRGARANATHCKKGHPLGFRNLELPDQPKRCCKICSVETIRQWAKANPDKMTAYQKSYRKRKKENQNRRR